MEIKKAGSQPSGKGPAEYFTGNVRVDPQSSASAPARVVVASVTFEPGARTAWHTHPPGQTLIVTAGGRVQCWGDLDRGNPAGGAVWIPIVRETLAWSRADYRYDPLRHSGESGREDGRVARARHRRAIPAALNAAFPRTRGVKGAAYGKRIPSS